MIQVLSPGETDNLAAADICTVAQEKDRLHHVKGQLRKRTRDNKVQFFKSKILNIF